MWEWNVRMIMVEGCIIVVFMIWILIEDDFGINIDAMITDCFVRVVVEYWARLMFG